MFKSVTPLNTSFPILDQIVIWTSKRNCRTLLERHIKTPKRYAESIAAALQDIKAQRYQIVHYISPSGQADLICGALQNVRAIKVAGEYVEITERHRARFKFFNLNEWPPVPIHEGGPSNE